MSATNQVVAHFLSGRLLKGTTQDFSPQRPSFRILPQSGGPAEQVQLDQLKAVFFVRSLEGNPERQDLKGFIAAAPNAQGKKIAVRFGDRELLCGHALSLSLNRSGFFVFPADPESNNIRVFVVMSPDLEIHEGPAAITYAEQVLRKAA